MKLTGLYLISGIILIFSAYIFTMYLDFKHRSYIIERVVTKINDSTDDDCISYTKYSDGFEQLVIRSQSGPYTFYRARTKNDMGEDQWSHQLQRVNKHGDVGK